MSQETQSEFNQPTWSSLYRAAGVCALVTVVFMLLDIALSFTSENFSVGTVSATEWFAQFQNNWLMGLRNLGFFNVINTTLTIPLYLAIYALHRKTNPAYATLAFALFLFSAAVYVSGNPALSMLSLSERYAAATSEAQRSLLASAGGIIMAANEDFTPGTFLGFFLTSASSVLMMAVMLSGRVFSRSLSLAGLLGWSFLLTYTIVATFIPAAFQLVMPLAILGGLLMVAWTILVGLRLIRIGRTAAEQSESATTKAALTAQGSRS